MVALLDPAAAELPVSTVEVAPSTRPSDLHGDGDLDLTALRNTLQKAMTAGAGVVRSATSLHEAMTTIGEINTVLQAHGTLTAPAV
jgi:succinate dehydrogenase/fumarate reductase flavoprotein subunit